MTNRSYANRGQTLEHFLRFANDRYQNKCIACISKVPTEFIPLRDRTGRICSAKVENKSIVDFLGRYKQYPIAIEAKHCATETIRFDRIEPHQAAYMDAFTAQPGTIGLVVVSFDLKRFFAIPWAFWQAAYNARVRPGANRTAPVTISAYGQTWNIPKKFSARVDEIPATFEIPNHDYTFGIDYLKNAEQYITPATVKPENSL